MNEDYLWDKTGEDPEIEKLENALAVFRYKETTPPELPAKVLPFKKKETPRSFFRFAYAAAACAAFLFVSLGIWLQFSNNDSKIAGDLSGTFAPQIDVIETPEKSIAPNIEETNVPAHFVKRNFIKAKKTVQTPAAQPKLFSRHSKKMKTDELTKEEEYAYNQLMLALSITGSKLRLVSDKIEGSENQNAVNKDGQ